VAEDALHQVPLLLILQLKAKEIQTLEAAELKELTLDKILREEVA
tara:strand:+ start:280 stop:414 length:135 start_codon:yes stop_codon:yes gene_type:complete